MDSPTWQIRVPVLIMIAWEGETVNMHLFILRHGKAAPSGSGAVDAERALTEKGRNEIEDIARWMATQGLVFDLIATSPLLRARETAEIVAGRTPQSRLESWASLSVGGSIDEVSREIAGHVQDSALLIVGHEPSLSLLIGRTIAGNQGAGIVLAKGGLAKIRNIAADGDQIRGELHWLLTPKQVPQVLR